MGLHLGQYLYPNTTPGRFILQAKSAETDIAIPPKRINPLIQEV